MDDLSGLDWSASSNSSKPKTTTTTPAFSSFPAIRPTPSPFASGRSTPISTQGSGTIAPKSNNNPFSKPAQDSFSNLGSLVSFGSSSTQNTAKLSLKEQQERLEAEKRRKEEERRQQLQAQYGGLDALGQLGSGSNSRTTSPAAFGFGAMPTSTTSIPSPAISRVASPLNPTTVNQLNTTTKKPSDSDDDLFAAFKAETKVDNASHYPPPKVSSPRPVTGATASAPRLDLSDPSAWGAPKPSTPVPVPAPAPAPVSAANTAFAGLDDDDPFGLGELGAPKKSAAPPPPALDEEDDLLGDLAKPVDQVKQKQQQLQQQQQRQPQAQAARPSFSQRREPGKPIEDDEDSSSDKEEPARPSRPSDDPFDRAVAQLVDYGFTPENARRGLTESGAGLNVQAAVNWLLDDAHRQAKEEARTKNGGGGGHQHTGRSEERGASQSRAGRGGQGGPSWMREEQQHQAERSRSRDNRSPASLAEVDFAKTAAAVGTSLFKTANSLWKTGQKKVQEAVKEFQQEGGDPNQPKWMRDAAEYEQGGRRPQAPDVTDEAMMLEGGGRPVRKPDSTRERPAEPWTASNGPQRHASPVPRWQQQAQSPSASIDPRSRLSKQATEEQSSQAYVSPARRKKATPQPQPQAPPPAQFEDEDLLFGSSAPSKSQPTTTPPPGPAAKAAAPRPPTPRRSPAPIQPKPAAPPRQVPPISAIALQSSTKHRLEGTAHFKRGDYAAAHTSYGASLSAIPSTHPLAILLLCNRALTALKVGEPRQAVQDADAAIALIGPSKGVGESVEVQTSEHGLAEKREMRDLYGKALTRKAEALEQMEKWVEAEKVWQSAVEAGLGGQTAAAGRQRCQKALAPKPVAAAAPVKKPSAAPARPRPTPTATSQKSNEAVQRLRLANQAAEKEGNEKFALADKVDAKIASWRDGKKDNLRALLSSLDNVLWEGSGWKKVGLHELVVANKVKIVYMKAIAKCHPDKVSLSVFCPPGYCEERVKRVLTEWCYRSLPMRRPRLG